MIAPCRVHANRSCDQSKVGVFGKPVRAPSAAGFCVEDE
jgi:hypothetical protein